MGCGYHSDREWCVCSGKDGDESVLMMNVHVDTPSIPIAAPATWLPIFTSLVSKAQARAAERFSFDLFMKLPREVRFVIYTLVLQTKTPILAHLCASTSSSGRPIFHDDNHRDHDGIWRLTSLTRVNRVVRDESLRVFYAVNTFAVGPDTTTYFAYLQGLGRLEWILNVDLSIRCGPVDRAAWVLRCVSQYDVEGARHLWNGVVDVYQKNEVTGQKMWKGGGDETSVDVDGGQKTLNTLMMLHPRYHVGGFVELNLAILLRMLCTAAPSGSFYARRIVLPVSNVDAFETNSSLRWFVTLIRGLGMELRFVERAKSATLHDGNVFLQWNRRFQGQDVETVPGGECEVVENDVLGRTLEMFPQLEEMRRPEKTWFYRKSCVSGELTWFDMSTLGGAHS